MYEIRLAKITKEDICGDLNEKEEEKKNIKKIVDMHICLHVLTVEAVRDPVTENVLLSISLLVPKEDICGYLNEKTNKNKTTTTKQQ